MFWLRVQNGFSTSSQSIVCTERIFISSGAPEEKSIKEIMEEDLMGGKLQSTKRTDEIFKIEINAVLSQHSTEKGSETLPF